MPSHYAASVQEALAKESVEGSSWDGGAIALSVQLLHAHGGAIVALIAVVLLLVIADQLEDLVRGVESKGLQYTTVAQIRRPADTFAAQEETVLSRKLALGHLRSVFTQMVATPVAAGVKDFVPPKYRRLFGKYRKASWPLAVAVACGWVATSGEEIRSWVSGATESLPDIVGAVAVRFADLLTLACGFFTTVAGVTRPRASIPTAVPIFAEATGR